MRFGASSRSRASATPQRISTPSSPKACQTPYGRPSGPGAERFLPKRIANAMSLRRIAQARRPCGRGGGRPGLPAVAVESLAVAAAVAVVVPLRRALEGRPPASVSLLFLLCSQSSVKVAVSSGSAAAASEGSLCSSAHHSARRFILTGRAVNTYAQCSASSAAILVWSSVTEPSLHLIALRVAVLPGCMRRRRSMI